MKFCNERNKRVAHTMSLHAFSDNHSGAGLGCLCWKKIQIENWIWRENSNYLTGTVVDPSVRPPVSKNFQTSSSIFPSFLSIPIHMVNAKTMTWSWNRDRLMLWYILEVKCLFKSNIRSETSSRFSQSRMDLSYMLINQGSENWYIGSKLCNSLIQKKIIEAEK